MQLQICRDSILKPLQFLVSIADRKANKPILANVLFSIKNQTLSLTASDLEVELVSMLELDSYFPDTFFTLPAKKLLDICRSLPEQSELNLKIEDNKALLTSGRSRFLLSTLPAQDYPYISNQTPEIEFSIQEKYLKELIENTIFSVAQQDVRYFLNGLLLKFANNKLLAVGTDGHRLAYSEFLIDKQNSANKEINIIVPRKGVLEIARMLTQSEETIQVQLTSHNLKIVGKDYIFTTKLIEGRFPDYRKVFPKNINYFIELGRDLLKTAISRTAILSNEKNRGVRLNFSPNLLKITANNPEQEEAHEELEINFSGEEIELGFNANYLLDVLPSNLAPGIMMLLSATCGYVLVAKKGTTTSLIWKYASLEMVTWGMYSFFCCAMDTLIASPMNHFVAGSYYDSDVSGCVLPALTILVAALALTILLDHPIFPTLAYVLIGVGCVSLCMTIFGRRFLLVSLISFPLALGCFQVGKVVMQYRVHILVYSRRFARALFRKCRSNKD